MVLQRNKASKVVPRALLSNIVLNRVRRWKMDRWARKASNSRPECKGGSRRRTQKEIRKLGLIMEKNKRLHKAAGISELRYAIAKRLGEERRKTRKKWRRKREDNEKNQRLTRKQTS